MNINSVSLGAAGLTAAIAFSTMTVDASARERQRSGNFQTGNGREGAYERNVKRENAQRQANTTWNTEHGTGSRQTNGAWDKSTGSGSYSSTTNTANGKTISGSGTVRKNADGTYTQTGMKTGANGNTVSGTKTYTKTETGVQSSGSYTTNNGKAGTVSSTTTRQDGTASRTTTTTNAQGEEKTRTGSVTITPSN